MIKKNRTFIEEIRAIVNKMNTNNKMAIISEMKNKCFLM